MTAVPNSYPTTSDEQCGKAKYCCHFVDIDGFERFWKLEAHQHAGYCCSETCSYQSEDGLYYLHYIPTIEDGGYIYNADNFYVSTSEPCHTSGGFSYFGVFSKDEMNTMCTEREPTPVGAPVPLPTPRTTVSQPPSMAPVPRPTPSPLAEGETRSPTDASTSPAPVPPSPTPDALLSAARSDRAGLLAAGAAVLPWVIL